MTQAGQEPTEVREPLGEPVLDPDNPSALIGHVVGGRYRVEAVLGSGGMGAVFRCTHLALHRAVALKLLHSDMSRNPEVAERFEREAQSASRLEHPNCIHVMDFGTWRPSPGVELRYLAMQLLEGHELSRLLGAPLAPTRTIDLALQIFAGLEHAHNAGIVHRDLKPENIFVTTDHDGKEQLKLVDFGIAKILQGEGAQKQLTQLGMVFGTPRYMSPEQAAGQPIDHRTDLYAAGVLMYQMLAGHPPFEADDISALLGMQIVRPPPPLSDDVPAALRDVTMKLLAKDRADRYASASEAIAALDKARPEDPFLAPTVLPVSSAALSLGSGTAPVMPQPDRRLALPRWWPVAAVGAVAVMIGVVLSRPSNDAGAEPEPVAATKPRSPGAAVGFGAHDAARTLFEQARALRKAGDPAPVLWAYARAADAQPQLLTDPAFQKEVTELLGRRKAARLAVLVAPALGEAGHRFLVRRVNDDRHPLPYAHRTVTVELLLDTDLAASVDGRLNRALDLWQARHDASPCDAFAAALDEVGRNPDPYYHGTLWGVTPPTPCPELPAKLDAARASLAETHPSPPRQWTGPRAYAAQITAAKKAKRRRRRGLFGGLRRAFGG